MYSQTYVVKQGDEASREAFFQCGEHCYLGKIELDLRHAFQRIALTNLPELIPIVQRQQGVLSYCCSARKIPRQSTFCAALEELEWARNFVVSEITSDSVSLQVAKLKEKHSWIDDDGSRVYFELVGDAPSAFNDILFIASRVYANGLRIDTLYFEGVIYLTLEDGDGEQPLLDVNFPDISGSGTGATLAIYDNDGRGRNGPWMKLSVWQAQEAEVEQLTQPDDVQPKTDEVPAEDDKPVEEDGPPSENIQPLTDLSSGCYVQSYCILKSDGKTDLRKVLFRFGSWCYAGDVELVPTISLSDIPFVVPALRVQQQKLKFVSDASQLPSASPFALAMEYAAQIQPIMEAQAIGSETYLRSLTHIGPNQLHWLEDDTSLSFFEFSCNDDEASSSGALSNVELLATKSYNANGIVSISVYCGGNWYLSLSGASSGRADFPLLDSKFPDFSQKGYEFSIQCYPSGISGWPQLREFSICCDQDAEKENSSEFISAPAKGDVEVSCQEDPGSCAQASAQPVDTTDSSNQPEEEENGSNKLKERLTAIADGPGEVAWDANGKPAHQTTEETADEGKAAPIPFDKCPDGGDIYAQLDWLDERLTIELDGLKGYL